MTTIRIEAVGGNIDITAVEAGALITLELPDGRIAVTLTPDEAQRVAERLRVVLAAHEGPEFNIRVGHRPKPPGNR